MKPTLKWIKENIQVAGLSITTDDNLIGSQFVTMTHTDHDVICEINDCLLSNFPAYYDHISYGYCENTGGYRDGSFLKITVWEDSPEDDSRGKCECYSCGFIFPEDEVKLLELKSVFLKWKECPEGSKWFCTDCQPKVDYNELASELLDLTNNELPSDEQVQDFSRCGDLNIDCITLKDVCIKVVGELEWADKKNWK